MIKPVNNSYCILFANSTKTWGGVKSWTLRVIHEASKRGIHTVLVARDPNFTEKAELAGASHVVKYRFGDDYSPFQIIRALLILRKMKPSVVVTNVSKELRSFGFAAKLLGIPVVSRLGLGNDLPDNFRTRLEYKTLVHSCIVPSYSIKRDLPHFLDKNKIKVIHNGVHPAQVNLSKHDAPLNELRIIYVGKLKPRKGTAAIIEAVNTVQQKFQGIIFDIIGDGEQENDLRSKYKDNDKIRFHGYQKDVSVYLDKAHIGIMNSSHEGLPNTLLEYLSHGLAVITTMVDGIPEVVEDKVTALSISFNNTQEIADRIETLLNNTELRKNLAENGVRRINESFNAERQANEVVDYLTTF